MDKDDIIEEHASFGVISWSRQHTVGGPGHDANLFGSDLKHHNLISLRIMNADRRRSLSRSWIHGRELVCEVILSPHQFAEFLTSPNQGDGIPCTIKHTQKERNIEYPGHETEAELHEKEFRQSVDKFKEIRTDVSRTMRKMQDGKTIKKGDFAELMKQVEYLMMHYESNLPFVAESFQKAMAKTVSAGKQEIEAYISKRITDAGLEALSAPQAPELIEGHTNAYQSKMKALEATQCDTCHGSGKVDDAEPGDISYNEYECPDCGGSGEK